MRLSGDPPPGTPPSPQSTDSVLWWDACCPHCQCQTPVSDDPHIQPHPASSDPDPHRPLSSHSSLLSDNQQQLLNVWHYGGAVMDDCCSTADIAVVPVLNEERMWLFIHVCLRFCQTLILDKHFLSCCGEDEPLQGFNLSPLLPPVNRRCCFSRKKKTTIPRLLVVNVTFDMCDSRNENAKTNGGPHG